MPLFVGFVVWRFFFGVAGVGVGFVFFFFFFFFFWGVAGVHFSSPVS